MISTLTGHNNSPIRSRETTEPCVIGCEVECDSVFSVSHGQIVDVGMDYDGYVVITVGVNHNEVIRYAHLNNSQFKVNQLVYPGLKLGDAHRYVVFEYCTAWKGQSRFPVRAMNYTYYKQDPRDILNGNYMPQATSTTDTYVPATALTMEYTSQDQQNEFNVSNKGGD